MGKGQEQFDELLKNLVPINRLAPQYQQEVLLYGEVVEYRRGKYIFKQGDQDNQAVYLLAGELEMYADGSLVKEVVAGTEAANYALAQLQPRQFSAKARTRVSVLRLDRMMLDQLVSLGADNEIQADMKVTEIETDEPLDWMTRMLQSELFRRLPASNIQRILSLMEPLEVDSGDVILSQGSAGDYFYVIDKGRCEVTRSAPSVKRDIRLAVLHEGHSFGEEALISDAPRNATVTMLTDGELMRLRKRDFVELIKEPALKPVSLRQAKRMRKEGVIWIDVRFPEEHAASGPGGSRNIPLNLLRMEAQKLDRSARYCIYCDTGQRSSAGAFLLTERGFDACYIEGGILERQPTQSAEPVPAKASEPAPPPPEPPAAK
ncbi:MAG: cyclic nucleotide-binding domain-containing protein, partial [Gammaproteobacteria bacterium]|nr:cyclic nucleotide-binding domain-containing protein [Gammaproteobacteria bacterium]